MFKTMTHPGRFLRTGHMICSVVALESRGVVTRRCFSGVTSAGCLSSEKQLELSRSRSTVACLNRSAEMCRGSMSGVCRTYVGQEEYFNLYSVRCSSSAKREPTVTEIRSSIQDHVDPMGVVKTKKFVATREELAAMLERGPDGVKLIDVREPREVEETGLLPRAVNIPLTSLKAALQLDAEMFETTYHIGKPRKDDPVPLIFYARSAVKSSAALEIAYKLGLKKSRHYPGGWEEWSTTLPPRSS